MGSARELLRDTFVMTLSTAVLESFGCFQIWWYRTRVLSLDSIAVLDMVGRYLKDVETVATDTVALLAVVLLET